jgi:hypothetical protein
LNACSDQLVRPWASLWSAEQIVSRLHVQAGENRCHQSDDPLPALIHSGILAVLRQNWIVQIALTFQ